MSMVVSDGILSRMVIKSRASMVPVRVRSVTVLFSEALRSVDNAPAVQSTVLLTCADKMVLRVKHRKRIVSFFIRFDNLASPNPSERGDMKMYFCFSLSISKV